MTTSKRCLSTLFKRAANSPKNENFRTLIERSLIGSLTGPSRTVTLAPAAFRRLANRRPISPVERLLKTRTSSIATQVGPHVIRIFLPASEDILQPDLFEDDLEVGLDHNGFGNVGDRVVGIF